MKQFLLIAVSVVSAGLSGLCFGQNAMARTEFANAVQPQLSAGPDGRVWLVYGQLTANAVQAAGHDQHKGGHGEGKKAKGGHGPQGRMGDVFVASSQDGGSTFTASVKVAHVMPFMVGNRRGPRIAAQGDRVTVTVIGKELVAYTSRDAGATWSRAVTINEVPDSAHEGLHDLAISPDGELFITWLDLRNGKTELWGASSKDGVAWGKNQLVYKSPDKSICECCHPSALFDAAGNLAVMWRNSIAGSRDMWLMTRPKGATQFTTARKLGEGTWKINGCPHDGGTLVALGSGKFGAVWQRSGDVFFTGADGAEVKLGSGRQPVAAGSDGKLMVVWNDGSSLVGVRDLRRLEPTKLAPDARFPLLVSLPDGKGAVLAYERGAKEGTSIAIERL